jgi:hypothetical protein
MADLTSKVISSNFQRLLQIDSGVVQDGTGSAFALRMSGSEEVGINTDPRDGTTLNVGGDIRVSGDIIAENYVVSSSITYMTQSFSSGSTIFGDSTEDTHQFTGNISVSGSTAGHITASGNISSSGEAIVQKLNVFGEAGSSGQIYVNDTDNGIGVADGLLINKSGTNSFIYNRDNGHLEIGTNDIQQLHIEDSATTEGQLKIKDGGIDVTGHITASGNISSSAIVKANQLQAYGTTGIISNGSNTFGNGASDTHEFTGNITASANITAGGDISASGNLIASGALFTSDDDADISRIYNTTDLFISASDDLYLTQDDIYIRNPGSGAWVTFDGGNARVGIGESSPTTRLHVDGTVSGSDVYAAESVRVTMTDGTTQRALSQQSGEDLQMGDAGINDLTFKNAVGTAVIMKDDGKVGIGTTKPGKELTVAGDISASGDIYLKREADINFGVNSGTRIYENSSDLTLESDDDLALMPDDDILIGQGSTAWAYFLGDEKEFRVTGDISSSGKIYDGTSYIDIRTAGNDLRLQSEGSGDIILHSERNWKFEDDSDGTAVKIAGEGHITASGNLLLTSSGDHKLTFDMAGEEVFDFTQGSSGLFIKNDGTNQLAFIQDHDIRIYNSSGNETATFRDSGRVGIGTLAPQNQLHISGSDGTSSGIRQSRAGVKIWSQEIDSSGRLQWSYRSTEAGSKTTTFTLDDTNDVYFPEGKVGIGTTSPTLGRLHVSGSGTNANYASLLQTHGTVTYQKFANQSTGVTSGDGFDIGANGTTAYLLNRENASMIFSTNDTERIRILADGNVGIGTTSPTKPLQVEGDISSSGTVNAASASFGGISVGDMEKIMIGDGDDLQIHHNGFNSFITDNGTGDLYIRVADNLRVQATSTNEDMIKATKNGAVELYYDNVKKLETTDDAATITATNMTMKVGVNSVATIFSSSGTHSHPDVLITDEDNADDRAALQVQGNDGATEVLFAASSGKVGIGTKTPTHTLTVAGDISASGQYLYLGHDDFRIQNTLGVNGDLTILPEGELKLGTTSTDIVTVGRNSWVNANSYVDIEAGSSNTLRVLTGGIVVGGTVTASNAADSTGDKFSILTVEGNISSSGGITLTKTATTSDVDSSSGNVTANNFSISHTLTLNAELADDAEHADITVTTDKCKASSVVVGCASAKVQVVPHTIGNGSFKFFFVNKSGGALADDATVVFNFTIM